MVDVIIPVYNQEELVVRAIQSVPIEWNIIAVNDGSTDNTLDTVLRTLRNNDILITYKQNKGVSHAINRALDICRSEYVVLLGSDDYFLPNIQSIALDGKDLIYFGLRYNDNTTVVVSNENKMFYCGSVKFMRREFIGELRNNEEMEYNEDADFMKKLLNKKPSETFSGIIGKHYNFPREGSLNWMAQQKL